MEKEIKEKNSNSSKFIIIALVIILLVLCGYIAYDKLVVKESNTSIGFADKNSKTAKSKEESLDVNSRLIQSLYNKVSTGEQKKEDASCNFNYIYNDTDFDVDKTSEQEKMKIVGKLLTNDKRKIYSNDETLIPDIIAGNDSFQSILSVNKKYGSSNTEYYYDKTYIENVYKEVYGTDAKLDTNAPIQIAPIAVELYSYVPAIDKYALYMKEGGGTCGPTGSYATLIKALKSESELKIYEKVTKIATEDATINDGANSKTYTKDQVINESQYIYTFKLAKDGMYDFVSRVKK